MHSDFRRQPPAPQSTDIKGETVEVVKTYKYVWSLVDNKLNLNSNTELSS